MIFEKQDIDLSTAVKTVQQQGLCIIKDWFTDDQVSSLKNEQLKAYETISDKKRMLLLGSETREEEFSQGKAIDAYKDFPSLVENVLYDEFLNNVINMYYRGQCQKFMQTFCTYENAVVADEDLGRHSRLHVDPYAALKLAFFPLGATKANGALRIIPGSRQEGVNIRTRFMSSSPKGLSGGIAHTIQEFREQCPELVTRSEDEIVYMECSPNDMCIVDTDTYHGGGLIEEEGEERLAVYIHSRP